MIYPLLECPNCHEKKMKLCTVVEYDELHLLRKRKVTATLGVKCIACGYKATLKETK